MSFTLEKVMRVWNDEEGVYLEVRQNPDFPDDGLEIHTDGNKKNEEWYGKISLCLYGKEQVDKMIQALIEMKDQIK